MEYLENILILKINNAYIYNKKYAYLCYKCYYKISNHNFYNENYQLFIDLINYIIRIFI